MRLDPHVTEIYAEGLFRAAKSQGVVAVATAQAEELLDLLGRERKLRRFFEAPHVPTAAKRDLVERLVRPNFHTLLTDFILLLVRKGRIVHLRKALERTLELEEIHRGIHAATVVTARAPDDENRVRLRTSLEALTGKKLKVDFRVDPTILGGVVFSCGTYHIDDSLRRHIDRLRQRLQAVEVI